MVALKELSDSGASAYLHETKFGVADDAMPLNLVPAPDNVNDALQPFSLRFDDAGLTSRVNGALFGSPAPATVSVLSGDVHHSYVCRAHWPQRTGPALSAVHQVTCSPLHNRVPTPMRLAFRLAWSGAARRVQPKPRRPDFRRDPPFPPPPRR